MPFNPNTAKLKFNPATAKPKSTVSASEQRAMKFAQDRAAAGHDDNAFLQSLGSIANGASFGLLNTIDAGRVKLQTQVENLARDAQGKPQRFSSDEAYRATKKVNDQASAKFAASHPVTNFTGNLMGGIIAPGVSPAATWAGAGKGLFSQVGRGALVGGATGAAYGAGGAEDGQRIKGAEVGGLTGAAIGGALPVVAAGVKAVAKPLVRTANKVINSATGGKVNVLNPQREAMKSVAAALKRDGATPEQAKQITNEWLKSGASSPSLMDMASKLPSGGQATIGLVRGAALPAGPARGAAIQYADQVASDLQGNAIGHARSLVPNETRSIPQIEEALQGTRAANANQNYAPLYQTPVNASDDVLSALADPQGASAVNNAIQAAVSNRDYAKAGELQSLLKAAQGNGQRPNVSAGALEEVRQALRDQGQAMSTNPSAPVFNRRAGMGLQGRASSLNDVLSQVPEIQPARADYANMSNQLDALGEGALAANPAQNPAQFQALMQQRLSKAQVADPFAGTKISDASGLPQTVYHGTNSDVRSFDFNKIGSANDDGLIGKGAYFTPSPKYASAYADGVGGNVIPSHLNIRNPYKMGSDPQIQNALNDLKGSQEVTDVLRKAGYDGVISRAGDEIVAFDPSQIRSTFDAPTMQKAQDAIRQSMQAGGARQMESQIGAAPEGALGYLKRLGTSTNAGQNLESLYGPDEAQRFQSAINNERLRVQNAQSVNPMSGSRTAVNVADTLDANTVGTAASALHGNFGPLLSKLISNPTLTDAEREHIVRLVLGQAQLPQVANANGPAISPYLVGATQQRNGNQ